MESEAVKPKAVACATEAVALEGREKTTGRALRASPFLERVEVGPSVCDAADCEDAGEKGEGASGRGAWKVRGLAGVVGDKSDGRGDGAELGFGGKIEGWETLAWGEDSAEAVASRGEIEDGGNVFAGLVDVQDNFVGEVYELHGGLVFYIFSVFFFFMVWCFFGSPIYSVFSPIYSSFLPRHDTILVSDVVQCLQCTDAERQLRGLS